MLTFDDKGGGRGVKNPQNMLTLYMDVPLAAEKKDSKNGAARKHFGTSYFATALVLCTAKSNLF